MTDSARALDRPTNESVAWVVIASLLAAVAVLQWRDPLPIDPASLFALFIASIALGGAALFYRFVRVQDNFAVICIGLIQALLFTAIGSVLSYMLARDGGVLWDERLRSWDAAIGFDWLAYVRTIDAHPWLVAPLHWAYGSLIPQLIVLLLALGFTLRLTELRRVMLAAILSGTATILLSSMFPAVANFAHLGLTVADFDHINPWAGYAHMSDFAALRNGSMSMLRLPEMQGIVTFPSYHAGLATVTLWGFWVSRIALLRWGGSAVALATIVATPVDGGHYLIDVIAGVAVGVLSIAASKPATRWRLPRLALTASPFRRLRAASAR